MNRDDFEHKLEELPQGFSIRVDGHITTVTVVAKNNLEAIKKAAEYFGVKTEDITETTRMWKVVQ